MLNHKHRQLMLQAQNQAQRDGWYSIKNINRDEAEVFIYGVIGASFFDEGVEALQFVKDIKALDAGTIHVRINSPGGNVFDAITMRNALQEHPAHIKTHIDGVAASAASWVASFDDVVMAPKSRIFIHDPMSLVIGNPEDLRKEAETLDSVGDDIADFLAERAGGSRQEWRDRMRAETWFGDQEAVDAGLADSIAGTAAVKNTFDTSILSIYANTPADLLERRNGGSEPTIRAAERALRDAGLSNEAAKAVLAKGWNAAEDDPRDVAALEALLGSLQAMRS